MLIIDKFNNDKSKIFSSESFWVNTDAGKLLDITCGHTAYIYGYTNETIFKKMTDVQQEVPYSLHQSCTYEDDLAKKICEGTDFVSVAWAISGSDGVEVALYTNDNYWKQRGEHKPKVLTFGPNYHGATYLAQIFRQEQNNPNRCVMVEGPGWNDINEREMLENMCINRVRQALENDNEIGAVLMEGAPWPERFRPWSESWWIQIRQVCDDFGVNLIVDDVFAGMGKTGYKFTHENYGITPDIACLGKSLTNGFSPLSCSCATEEITYYASKDFDYSHTWSPNMAGIGAGLGVFELFDTEQIAQVNTRLHSIADKLKEDGLVTQIYSQGLLMQIDLTHDYDKSMLQRHGINGFLKESPNTLAILICAHANATEEFFVELEKRLTEALNDHL